MKLWWSKDGGDDKVGEGYKTRGGRGIAAQRLQLFLDLAKGVKGLLKTEKDFRLRGAAPDNPTPQKKTTKKRTP